MWRKDQIFFSDKCYVVSEAGRSDLNGIYIPCSSEVSTARLWQEHSVCWMKKGTEEPTTVESPIFILTDSTNPTSTVIFPPRHDYASNNITGSWRITNGLSPPPAVIEISCAGICCN